MKDIKQKLLEEFDKKFINDNYSYSTGNFNSIDPVVNKLKQFLSKTIDKTREETIRKVEEVLDKYFEGLIVVPYPELTRDQIKKHLNKLKK